MPIKPESVKAVKAHSQRLSQDFVQTYIESFGFSLNSQYRNWRTKMDMTCPNGHEFQMDWSHFKQGFRCKFCSGKVVDNSAVLQSFIDAGLRPLSPYKNVKAKIDFICGNGHHGAVNWHEFQKGTRCAQCAKTGYKPERPGRLYYLRIESPDLLIWKVGITNRTIKQRFRGELNGLVYTVLLDEYNEDGRVPLAKESEILAKYREYQYTGTRLKSGNTEAFTVDVLGLDWVF